jgi:hypothetical protein
MFEAKHGSAAHMAASEGLGCLASCLPLFLALPVLVLSGLVFGYLDTVRQRR